MTMATVSQITHLTPQTAHSLYTMSPSWMPAATSVRRHIMPSMSMMQLALPHHLVSVSLQYFSLNIKKKTFLIKFTALYLFLGRATR